MKYIHLSETNLDGVTITPKIPKNFMTKLGYEDSTIPRISVAPTIDNCILGIGYNRIKDGNRRFYVHEPEENSSIKVISNDEIVRKNLTPDAKITKESWITSECKLKCIGYIDITEAKEEYETVFYNGKEITKQYYWNYNFVPINNYLTFK
jgi:hypothetical protein